MSANNTSSPPHQPRQHVRITHLDTIRGIAVMGILVMNSISFFFGGAAYFDISAAGSHSSVDWFLGIAGEVFADQKFMGLFSLLFGASILLFVERAKAKGHAPVKLSLWRNTLLLVIGILHVILWEGDVLIVYALCAPILLLAHKRSHRFLVGAGLFFFALSILQNWLLGYSVDDATVRSVWAAPHDTTGLSPEAELMGLSIVVDAFTRALGMMFIGMGLYRSGTLTRPDLDTIQLKLSLAAVGLGAILAGIGVGWTVAHDFHAPAIIHGNVANGLGTVPMTLGYLGLLIWWNARAEGPWVERVRALGQMALTNYIGQTVIGLSLAVLLPPAWISRSSIWVIMGCIWLIQLYGSKAWLDHHRFGPLEWLWRCATYRRREPLKRQAT